MQNRVGAVVERMKGWNDAAPTTQTRGAESSLAGRLVLELCLGKEEAGTCKVLEKNLIIESTESSSFCNSSFGNTIWALKTTSAGERPVSSLSCALSPRSTKGNSSDHVTAAAHAQSDGAVFRPRHSTQGGKLLFVCARC